MSSILENYQKEDHIEIPEVLWEYFKEKEIR
jgi:seryl-tRNA synthetase